MDAPLAYWPVALATGTGLLALGRIHAKVEDIRKDVDKKASVERIEAMDARLERIDNKLDRLIDNLPEKKAS